MVPPEPWIKGEQEECGGILQKEAQQGDGRARDGTQAFSFQFL